MGRPRSEVTEHSQFAQLMLFNGNSQYPHQACLSSLSHSYGAQWPSQDVRLLWSGILHHGTEMLCLLRVANAEHDSLWLGVRCFHVIVQGQRQVHTDHLWALQLQEKENVSARLWC